MLGFAALAEVALAEVPGVTGVTPASPTPKIGWFDQWDKRRRIPVEQLREILKAQGSRWADELGDAYEVAEKKGAKAPRRRKVIEEVLADVSERIEKPGVDWGAICVSLLALASATRETLARKHAERIALLLDDDDEEEAIVLLLMEDFDGW